jgi:hypothetical protein
VGELLLKLGRHNLRPNHLHMMIDAPGFRKLTTALFPEGDAILSSDAVFGVKKSLVVVSKNGAVPPLGCPSSPFSIYLMRVDTLGRNLSTWMTRRRRVSVDSRKGPSSSCSSMTSSFSLRRNLRWAAPSWRYMRGCIDDGARRTSNRSSLLQLY